MGMVTTEDAEGATAPGVAYDDEVLNAGWAELPALLPGPAAPAVAHEVPADDAEEYLARLYVAEGMVGR